jgi:predicted enzyme related to lactoylglutathione lyase
MVRDLDRSMEFYTDVIGLESDEVEDPSSVDPVCERIAEAGETVPMEPTDVDWGRRVALVDDPDGYTLEISAPL